MSARTIAVLLALTLPTSIALSVRRTTDLKKQGVSAEDAAQRVDLTSHQKEFPSIQRPGADIRGVRRLYAWIDERGTR